MPIVFAILNRKGGVGKTSLTMHVAGAYAAKGRRVLLLDLDPQASLTQGLLGPEATERLPPAATVAALFDGDPDPARLVTDVAGIALVPGAESLNDANVPRPDRAGPYQTVVRDFLAECGGGYDVVLIDCPPNLYLCSWCALLAADHVVVPLQAEDYGSQGIVRVQQAVGEARERNPGLTLLGYVVTMIQKLAVHELYETYLRKVYGGHVLTNTVPLLADFKRAIAEQQPIERFKPRSQAARVIRAVADELWLRAWVERENGGRQASAGEVA